MIKLPAKVRLEQAVYGSFPFWHRGYAVLSRSAGCRPEWIAELRTACQRCGEPPAGAAEAESLFALRLACGTWMIVGVYPQGCDDHGRPGALAFHALFVGPWAYQWAGANPFAFVDVLRSRWRASDQDRDLPAIIWSAGANRARTVPNSRSEHDARLASIVAALSQGRPVVVQSTEPIDDLARAVWRVLPRSVRRRATVATWAFDNANRFDLIALPKLTGVELDPSALILALEHAGA